MDAIREEPRVPEPPKTMEELLAEAERVRPRLIAACVLAISACRATMVVVVATRRPF